MARTKAEKVAYGREWREKNREHYREYRRARYAAKKDSINQKRKDARAVDPERFRSKDRERHAKNRERASAQSRESRKRHGDKWNAKRRERYQNDPEYRRNKDESDRRYRAKNQEKKAAYVRAYYAANKERVLEKVHAYYREHRDETIQKKKEWRHKNPARARKIARDKDARKKNARGAHTFEQWMRRVEVHGWRCRYCRCVLSPQTLSQDHAIPLSRGGTNFASNLVPACMPCNSGKKDSTLLEYLARVR